MLFCALAGKFPYPVDCDLDQVILNIANAEPGSLARIAQENGMQIVPGIDAVVHRALCKRPDERYQSAAAFADDLESSLAGRPPLVQSGNGWLRWVLIMIAVLVGGGIIGGIKYWQDRPALSFTNTMSMRFVRIIHGRAIPDWAAKAGITSIDHDFYLSVTDVTQLQYMMVVGHNPSDKRHLDYDSPVENVTQPEAIEFCRLLTNRERRVYRLPTPDEWKYAYATGQLATATDIIPATRPWEDVIASHGPQRVGQGPPDLWGLYDMIGNVGQWCVNSSAPSDPSFVEGVGSSPSQTHTRDLADFEEKIPSSAHLNTVGFRVACDSSHQN
jgi:hypothetical protein